MPGAPARRGRRLALAVAGMLSAAGGLAAQDSVHVEDRAAHYPHEPPGFQPFAEFDCSALPLSRQPAPDGLAGHWYNEQASRAPAGQGGAQPGLRLRQDPTAPQSPPGVLAMVYPRGFPAGRGPANWGGWDAAGAGPAGQKRAIYLSMWLKLARPDYENHAVGTKIAFIGVGLPSNAPGQSGNQIVLFMKGVGRIALGRAFPVELHQFFTQQAGAPFLAHSDGQNVNRGRLMTAGAWHHWELVMSLNDPGLPNGHFRWWIDGTLVMDYSNRLFRPLRGRAGFWNLKINPTWGGMGGQKTREDAILIDHVYLSGIPLASRGAGDSE